MSEWTGTWGQSHKTFFGINLLVLFGFGKLDHFDNKKILSVH